MIVFVIGPTCGGKSIFIRERFPDFTCIDLYDFQTEIIPYGADVEKLMAAEYEQCKLALIDAVKQHENVVLEHTMLKKIRRAPYIEAVRGVSSQDIVIYVINPSLETFIEHSKKRNVENMDAHIKTVIRSKEILEIPTLDEGFAQVHVIDESGLPDISVKVITKEEVNNLRKCHDAKTVIIPEDVTGLVSATPFYDWSSLENIRADQKNEAYASVDGVLFNKDKTVLIRYPEGRTQDSYVIPEGVTEIGKGAFSDYESIFSRLPAGKDTYGYLSVTIPESVEIIPLYAFNSCSGKLKAICVSERNKHYASLSGVLFDKAMKTLVCCPSGIKAESYVIPDGVTVIDEGAFGHCKRLKEITIPDSVTIIREFAFEECTNLINVTIPGSVTNIGYQAFSTCTRLTDVTMSDGIESIGKYAFGACHFLKNIVIPPSVREIGENVFFGNNNVTVFCRENSYAHDWAKEKSVKFKLTNDDSIQTPADAEPGNIRLEGEGAEKLFDDPEIKNILEKIADIAGPIFIKTSKYSEST